MFRYVHEENTTSIASLSLSLSLPLQKGVNLVKNTLTLSTSFFFFWWNTTSLPLDPRRGAKHVVACVPQLQSRISHLW